MIKIKFFVLSIKKIDSGVVVLGVMIDKRGDKTHLIRLATTDSNGVIDDKTFENIFNMSVDSRMLIEHRVIIIAIDHPSKEYKDCLVVSDRNIVLIEENTEIDENQLIIKHLDERKPYNFERVKPKYSLFLATMQVLDFVEKGVLKGTLHGLIDGEKVYLPYVGDDIHDLYNGKKAICLIDRSTVSRNGNYDIFVTKIYELL